MTRRMVCAALVVVASLPAAGVQAGPVQDGLTGVSTARCLAADVALGAVSESLDERCPNWVTTYSHDSDMHLDLGGPSILSPDGATVFVTGTSWHDDWYKRSDIATVAIDTSSGSVRWVSRYVGLRPGGDQASSVLVTPDGDSVVVAGTTRCAGHEGQVDVAYTACDFLAVAYDAHTGAEKWATRTDLSIGAVADVVRAAALSPDGRRLFVTGWSTTQSSPDGVGERIDGGLVAYDVQTGAELWVERFDLSIPKAGSRGTDPREIAVSRDGRHVVISALTSWGDQGGPLLSGDTTLASFSTEDGSREWTRTFGLENLREDFPFDLLVAENGLLVSSHYVIPDANPQSAPQAETVALDPATGEIKWAQRRGDAGDFSLPMGGLAASGDMVSLAAIVPDVNNVGWDTEIISYDADDGSQLWESRMDRDLSEAPTDIAFSRDGETIHVAGMSTQLGSQWQCYVIMGAIGNNHVCWFGQPLAIVSGTLDADDGSQLWLGAAYTGYPFGLTAAYQYTPSVQVGSSQMFVTATFGPPGGINFRSTELSLTRSPTDEHTYGVLSYPLSETGSLPLIDR